MKNTGATAVEEHERVSAAGAAGAESEAVPPPPPESCELNGSCVGSCTQQRVTCGVQYAQVGCELQGFDGATAEVSCNESAVIGTACCGACGCVKVEVYFDGTYCWQGAPECKDELLANRMMFPHAPTTPNPTFTPPTDIFGSFYLGTGGFGGGDAQGGSSGSAGSGGLIFVGGSGGASAAVETAGAGSSGIVGSGGIAGSGGWGGAGVALDPTAGSAGVAAEPAAAGSAGTVNVGGLGGAGVALDSPAAGNAGLAGSGGVGGVSGAGSAIARAGDRTTE